MPTAEYQLHCPLHIVHQLHAALRPEDYIITVLDDTAVVVEQFCNNN